MFLVPVTIAAFLYIPLAFLNQMELVYKNAFLSRLSRCFIDRKLHKFNSVGKTKIKIKMLWSKYLMSKNDIKSDL